MMRKNVWPDDKRFFYERIGDHLRDMRIRTMMTQSDAAKQFGFSTQMLCNIERGNRSISLDRFEQMLTMYTNKSVLDM